MGMKGLPFSYVKHFTTDFQSELLIFRLKESSLVTNTGQGQVNMAEVEHSGMLITHGTSMLTQVTEWLSGGLRKLPFGFWKGFVMPLEMPQELKCFSN